MFASCPDPLPLERGLADLSLEELAEIGKRLGFRDELTSKARLLAEAPEGLKNRVAVRRLLRGLAPAEEKALAVAAAVEKLSPAFGASLLFRFAPSHPPGELGARALLLPDPAIGLYRIPEEILPRVYERTRKELIGPDVKPPPSPATLDPRSAFRDAVAIWCYLIKNPITLTQGGATPKRALAKLLPLLEVAEEGPPVETVTRLFGSNRLEFLLEDGERRGAWEKNEGGLIATDWLSSAVTKFADHFNAELVAATLEADETGAALLAAFAYALAPPDTWRPLSETAAAVKTLAGECEAAAVHKALYALFVTGAVAAGADRGGTLRLARVAEFDALGAAAEEAAAPEFLLGGNFELKVAYDVPIETRLKIEAFAEQIGGGRFLSYRLSKSSFYRALDAGVTVGEVLSFLNEHLTRPLPQNVEFSLRDWADQYGTVAFYDRLVIATEKADVADEIARLPTLAPFVKGRRELHAVEIARENYAAVRGALTAAGYLPKSLRGKGKTGVSPRALFDADARSAARPEATRGPGDHTAAVIAFAVRNNRPLKIWLEGEEEPFDVQPAKITIRRGEAFLHVARPRELARLPLAAITRAAFR